MSTDSARRAAALLPRAHAGVSADRDRGDAAILWLSVAVFVVMPFVVFVAVLWLPWGWAIDLAGVPAWLAVRWFFFRMRGSESGMVRVDDDGVIHVLSGQLAIKRLQRLYDVGSDSWMRQTWLTALVMIGILLGLPTALTFLFDNPAPFGVFLTGVSFGMLDFIVHLGLSVRRQRQQDSRALDGSAMLPALALYARHHGWRQAVSGVPADRLAATLAAHPKEVAVAERYAVQTAYMAQLARLGAAAGGIAGTS